MEYAIRFLDIKRIKGDIIEFGCFEVDVETEKGRFSVLTDKLHHPEWYGMVCIEFADEGIRYPSIEDESVHGNAWTDDERIIAALARLTSEEADSVDIENPTKEDARKVLERLKIPNAPGDGGWETHLKIFGRAKYLDRNGRVMDEHDSEVERFMCDGMTREQAEARWRGSHG